MPRLKGPPKAQIRLRVSKSVAAAVTARGQEWFERTLRLALRNGGQTVSLVVDRRVDGDTQLTAWPPGARS